MYSTIIFNQFKYVTQSTNLTPGSQKTTVNNGRIADVQWSFTDVKKQNKKTFFIGNQNPNLIKL